MGRRGGRGHFCWCCGQLRANEAFSGKGHARHLCRACAKLGKDELARRQTMQNMDQALDWNGLIRRKQRRFVERFLTDEDPQLREHATRLLAADREERAEVRRLYEEDEAALEAMSAQLEVDRPAEQREEPSPGWCVDDVDLPF